MYVCASVWAATLLARPTPAALEAGWGWREGDLQARDSQRFPDDQAPPLPMREAKPPAHVLCNIGRRCQRRGMLPRLRASLPNVRAWTGMRWNTGASRVPTLVAPAVTIHSLCPSPLGHWEQGMPLIAWSLVYAETRIRPRTAGRLDSTVLALAIDQSFPRRGRRAQLAVHVAPIRHSDPLGPGCLPD